ncbi:MAG: GrpE protein [Anaerocolumna sp.]|nr:GrpE protein [Anaerocolumna sp.]
MEDKTNSVDETLKDKDINPDVSEDTLEKTVQESDMAAEDTDAAETVEETDEEDTEEDGKDGQKSGKSFFRKDKKEKKDKKDLKIDELNDRLVRTMAEFDNFRKRSEKEKSQMFEIGARDIIEKILPVIDNFERGLGAISEEERESAFAQGFEKIYKQMFTALSDAGLKPIEAVGKPFDPNFHNAVMHAEDPEQGENLVAEEFQKGYSYRDVVIRHSMVKVVN